MYQSKRPGMEEKNGKNSKSLIKQNPITGKLVLFPTSISTAPCTHRCQPLVRLRTYKYTPSCPNSGPVANCSFYLRKSFISRLIY